MPSVGDKVKIATKKETIEGLFMPSFDENIILIKLSTGYNIGLEKKDIQKITVTEKAKEPIATKTKITKNQDLPTISILHTGGTIASKVDYRTGGVVSNFTPQQLLSLYPELQNIANIESQLISQMWSDDLRFKHITLIAKAIEQHVKKENNKGIIVAIGTDNLTVAAAALSFIIEQTPIPIILVGSQRSSDRGSSDGGMNLICAAQFITQSSWNGVAICMHESENDDNCLILPATKTYKLHSSRRDAFKPINADALAKVNYQTKKVEFLKAQQLKQTNQSLIIKPKLEEKVGLLKIHINMFPEQFEFYKGYKGLIIEGTGLGHTPGQTPNPESVIHKKIYPAIKKLTQSGCIVVMTTQCLFGGVNMNVYDKGRDLINLGVISGEDMLVNTALVKLSWLLANYPKNKVKELVGENLRGEINTQHNYQEKFLK